jgi:predicted RNA-binding Zn ribbon-like protein
MSPIPAPQHATEIPHGHQVDLETGLDFINTLEFEKGQPVEHFDELETALAWLFRHDLLHRDMLKNELRRSREDAAGAEKTLHKIRRVRTAMRELADATVERRPAEARQVDEVNRALRTHYVYYLVPGPDGVSMDHRHDGDPVDGAMARLAESLAREVSQGHPERLRICDNDECRWIFNDTSRTGKRRWCDMSTCGNRAKVARHRARARERYEAESAEGATSAV